MPNNLIQIKKRKQDLLRYLEIAKTNRSKTIRYNFELTNKLKQRQISEVEYNVRTNLIFKDKSPEEWVSYYNNLISDYERELTNINNKVIKEENRKIDIKTLTEELKNEIKDKSKFNTRLLLTISIFLLLAFTAFMIFKPEQTSLTGVVVYQPNTIINDTITLSISNNITINESSVIAKLNTQQSELPLTDFNIIDDTATIDLTKFNLLAEDGNLTIQIIYNDSIIKETSLLIETAQETTTSTTTTTLITPIEQNIIKAEIKANKKHYKLDEIPEFDFDYSVFDKEGKRIVSGNEQIEAYVWEANRNTGTYIRTKTTKVKDGSYKVDLIRNRNLKAGNYRLIVNLIDGENITTIEKEFTWGVLAINLDKSIYLENENSFISMAVLDDNGRIICNANVNLDITDPSGKLTTLKTSDNTIKVSPECEKLAPTELPDYYTNYTVNKEGIYNINLTAITNNGIRTINDKIIVQKNVDFDISRKSATRIYPPADYIMNIKIKANKSYNGLITEYAPETFEIKKTDANIITNKNNHEKILSWNVKLKKDDFIELNYTYNAPDISPELFLLGPLEIGNFKETRNWQLAVDPASGTFTTFWFTRTNASRIGVTTRSGNSALNLTNDNTAVASKLAWTGTTNGVTKYWNSTSLAKDIAANGTFFTPNFSIPAKGSVEINGTWEVSIQTDCNTASAAAPFLRFILFKLNSTGPQEYNLTTAQNADSMINSTTDDICGTNNVQSQNASVIIPPQFDTGFTNLTGDDRVGVRILMYVIGTTTSRSINLDYNSTASYVKISDVIRVNYPPANVTPIINSTSFFQLNLTTEDLLVSFNASDPNSPSTLNYSITWFKDNVTNFTITNLPISNPGGASQVLISKNTTKGENWSAQIQVCDEFNACNFFINTSQLFIRNSNITFDTDFPKINSTNALNRTSKNLTIFWNATDFDETDVLRYNVTVYTNNMTNFTIYGSSSNGNLFTNGTFVMDFIDYRNLTVGQTWKAKIIAYDDTKEIYANTSELLIVAGNTAPRTPVNLTINSTSALQLNKTDEHLTMNFQCDDPDTEASLTFYLTAFSNQSDRFQLIGTCNDPEVKSVLLNATWNTSKGEVWSFTVNLSDSGGLYSNGNSTLTNLTIINSDPIISNITFDQSTPVSVTENGNTTLFFSFIATDIDNQTDMNNLSAVANITRGSGLNAETTRTNDTFVTSTDGGCNFVNLVNGVNGNTKNFSCAINIVFYDGAGLWNISTRINDTTGVFVQNITQTFSINELTAIQIDRSSISFPTVVITSVNVSSRVNLTINNTGNDDISGLEATREAINITAITLVPESGATGVISTQNFSVGVNTTYSSYCDTSLNTNTTRLINSTEGPGLTLAYNNFSGTINNSIIIAAANINFEILSLCLLDVPDDLSASENYSTLKSGTWTLSIW